MSCQYPALFLEAKPYNEVFGYSKVLNVDQIEPYILVHIPDLMAAEFELYDFSSIFPEQKDIDWVQYVTRDCMRPWFKVNAEIIDKAVGQHIYRFDMVNRQTNDVLYLFICFDIQDNNPDRPYIYMNSGDSDE